MVEVVDFVFGRVLASIASDFYRNGALQGTAKKLKFQVKYDLLVGQVSNVTL